MCVGMCSSASVLELLLTFAALRDEGQHSDWCGVTTFDRFSLVSKLAIIANCYEIAAGEIHILRA